jgi:ABC-type Fe3+/spermidine/putrescine transport system ATPase subunit
LETVKEPVVHLDTDWALKIEGVGKSFSGQSILKEISLSVPKGQFFVVVGPSGCGKSTLLNLVAGFEYPSKGVIEMGGTVVSSESYLQPPNKRDIGMIFQSLALWPHMSVYENVEFPLKQKFPKECKVRGWAGSQIMDSLELVGLADQVQKMPHHLSGGQQQRVALARALVTKPAILLMDEPLSSLDTALRERMSADIRRIQLMLKNTVLYVTHDQREAMTLADKVVVMNKGIIEQSGAPEDVYLNPRTPFVAQFVSRGNILNTSIAKDIANTQNVQLNTREPQVAALREQIDLEEMEHKASAENHVAMGKIISRQFLGTGFEYSVELYVGGFLVSHSSRQLDVGKRVMVKIKAFQTFD